MRIPTVVKHAMIDLMDRLRGAALAGGDAGRTDGQLPDSTDLDSESIRPQLLQMLAAAQAEAGAQQAALTWIARLPSPNLRARALVGVAEGLAYRAGAKRPPVD